MNPVAFHRGCALLQAAAAALFGYAQGAGAPGDHLPWIVLCCALSFLHSLRALLLERRAP